MLNEKESEVHPMLSIVHRGEHQYDIFENDRDIGSVSVSRSPLYDRHCQLHLELERPTVVLTHSSRNRFVA